MNIHKWCAAKESKQTCLHRLPQNLPISLHTEKQGRSDKGLGAQKEETGPMCPMSEFNENRLAANCSAKQNNPPPSQLFWVSPTNHGKRASYSVTKSELSTICSYIFLQNNWQIKHLITFLPSMGKHVCIYTYEWVCVRILYP